MTTKNDGGPVYPSEQSQTADGTWNQTYCQGMYLRDRLAESAMKGMAAGAKWGDNFDTFNPEYLKEVAKVAYAAADAMLGEKDRCEAPNGIVEIAVEALQHYATCSDGCTCGNGWSHEVAKTALAKLKH